MQNQTTSTQTASARPENARKAALFTTARAKIGCAAFRAGDTVGLTYMHSLNGQDWYLCNYYGREAAYPAKHLYEFVI